MDQRRKDQTCSTLNTATETAENNFESSLVERGLKKKKKEKLKKINCRNFTLGTKIQKHVYFSFRQSEDGSVLCPCPRVPADTG